MTTQARVYVEKELMDDVKRKLPEAKGMTYTGLVDYVLRIILQQQSKEVS